MAKKNPLFSKTQLALFLGVSVFLLLCFIIRFLPDRFRPETKTSSRTQTTTETVQATKEPEPSLEPSPAPTELTTTNPIYSELPQRSKPPQEKPSVNLTSAIRPSPTESKKILPRKNRKALVIVIDDVGQKLQELEPFLKLPVSLTFSTLPHLAHSQEAVKRIKAAGKEAILHMPMEPEPGRGANPGPGALYTAYSNQQLVEFLDDAFTSVPGVRGFNNHMGSLFTANIEAMRVVFRYAEVKGLFFLDSRTATASNASVAPEVAREYHVPLLERTAPFLDNDPAPEAIKAQLTKVLELVVKEADRATPTFRPVITIGHVQSHALPSALREMLPLFKQEGVEFARLDEFCN